MPRTNSAKFVRAGSSAHAAGRLLPIPRGSPHAMEMPLARLRKTSTAPDCTSGLLQPRGSHRGWEDWNKANPTLPVVGTSLVWSRPVLLRGRDCSLNLRFGNYRHRWLQTDDMKPGLGEQGQAGKHWVSSE